MHCPYCRHTDTRVLDSRVAEDGTSIRRRRSCSRCEKRFTTVEAMQLTVVKRSGATEAFSRDKAVSGVRKACKGRPVTEDQLAVLGSAGRGRAARRRAGQRCRPTRSGLAILGPLRELDEVAYLRFASVYRAFESADDFEAEIAVLASRAGSDRRGARAAYAQHDRSPRQDRHATRSTTGTTEHSTCTHRHYNRRAAPDTEGPHRRGRGRRDMTETDSRRPSTKKGAGTKGLKMERIFTTEGEHPYDAINWERRDVVQQNWKTGETVFEQRGVEFPDFWSVNASTIVTTKYFRGAVGTDVREWSLKQLVDRVVHTYTKAGKDNGYFATPDDAEIFEHELTHMLVHQVFSFNSPVWFNVGTKSPQQVSACFILSVDDSMDSILNWYKEEGFIFKGGSGAGLNLSRIRSSKELLSSGGTASGPVSFMRGADASAGTIKSGGATRRAAKMVVLDVDHPDIEEFVETKAREEDKIRALRDAGFDMDLGGKDIVSVQYQNANNSVRVTDEFMRAVEEGTDFGLRARGTGEVIDTVDARELFAKIAKAAWECADPGIQYDDTINDWHTNPETGRITASNPCSEYMSLDNSSCNLASLNLLKFLKDDDSFDAPLFARCVEMIITAMDISICFADFPTEAIGQTTRDYRQLGIGYANLGALLMAMGLGYDSEGGRALAARSRR